MTKSGKKCPTCHAPSSESYKPFCSQRCRQLDLGRWFNESYTVPSEEEVDEGFLYDQQNSEELL